MYIETISSSAVLALIPDGVRGVKQTLSIMRVFVREGKKSMIIRETALSHVAGLMQKDYWSEASALQQFVRDNIRYVGDIADIETVQTAEATLRLAAGDCDDKSVLVAALLESIGHPTKFIAVGFNPGHYEHVYVEVKLYGSWIGVETTEPVDLGWAPPIAQMRARMECEV